MSIEKLEQQISELRQAVTNSNRMVETLRREMDEMHRAVFGDERLHHEGLTDMVHSIRNTLEQTTRSLKESRIEARAREKAREAATERMLRWGKIGGLLLVAAEIFNLFVSYTRNLP